MYHAIVRRRIRETFERQLSNGDHATLLAGMAPGVVHTFAGKHALGGTRRGRDAVAAWLKRLSRLYPSIAFHVEQLVVAGWPWRTFITVRWHDWGEAADGVPYENWGCHVLVVRWGRLASFTAYLDTQTLVASLERMAAAGIAEAGAAPIVEAP